MFQSYKYPVIFTNTAPILTFENQRYVSNPGKILYIWYKFGCVCGYNIYTVSLEQKISLIMLRKAKIDYLCNTFRTRGAFNTMG